MAIQPARRYRRDKSENATDPRIPSPSFRNFRQITVFFCPGPIFCNSPSHLEHAFSPELCPRDILDSVMSLPSQPSPRNDLLKTHWKTRLHNIAPGLVTPFVNQHGVYAASNGYIHRLSPRTGSRLKTISLRQPTARSSRVVQLTAPPSSFLLIVGINRRVLALDPISLSTLWETILPHVGDGNHRIVSIFHHVQNISGGISSALSLYAACYGYVYRIDPWTGTIVAKNPLRGGGFFEVRLRMDTSTSMTAGAILMVGTHGRVYALDPFTLETIWRRKLPLPNQDPTQPEYRKRDHSPEGQITEVLCGSSADTPTTAGETRTQVLHAFWERYHFQLTRQDGKVLKRTLMGEIMTSDLQLTLDNPKKRVYIIDRSQGETICAYICRRKQSLKWTYRHQVQYPARLHGTVIPGRNGMAWFPEFDRVVLRDEYGKEVASHRFDASFGRGQPQLAVYTDRTGDAISNFLMVGISGRCVALEIPTDVFRLDEQTAVHTQPSQIPTEPSPGTGAITISETGGSDVMDTANEEADDAPPSYFESQEQYRAKVVDPSLIESNGFCFCF
ncbi:hypothetical protein V8F33_008760 [Rhypophila sp. PSN 637]